MIHSAELMELSIMNDDVTGEFGRSIAIKRITYAVCIVILPESVQFSV